MELGMVGLGRMGANMAERLLRGGHKVTGFDPNADARKALAGQIERRAAAAQDKIAQAETAALNEIRALAADATVSAAQKLIVARLDDARASKLVDSAIKDLGDKLN